MAELQMSIQAQMGKEWRQFKKQMRAAPKELQKELNQNIKVAGRTALMAVRAAALGIPVTGKKHVGLRRAMAKATKLQATAKGIRIVVRTANLPEGRTRVPALLDQEKWRHPVFGDEEKWVTQLGHPWFLVTNIRHAPEFRRAINKAKDDMMKKLEIQ